MKKKSQTPKTAKALPQLTSSSGIPKVAKIYAAAHNAVKLATLFLGNEVPNEMIEAQALDFMRLGTKRLVESIQRFADTEVLYKSKKKKKKKI